LDLVIGLIPLFAPTVCIRLIKAAFDDSRLPKIRNFA
jgi:hypothetical protein